MSIPTAVECCRSRFNVTRMCLEEFENKRRLGEYDEIVSRFNMWMLNIAAHKQGTTSLAYRLRDSSHITNLVVDLLKSISEATEEAEQISLGSKTSWQESEGMDTSDDEDDSVDFAMEPERIPAKTTSEIDHIFSHILGNIRCLLRLSIAIRHPAPHDRFLRSGGIDISPFESYDVAHVRDKFPFAEPFLFDRLGKAISRRRLYLKYREQHKAQLANPTHSVNDDQTAASSLPSLSQLETLDVMKLQFDNDSESGMSRTSYATTNPQSSALSVPKIPDNVNTWDPFECPFCFCITVARNRKDWK
jgi:hypothetical protein